MNISSQIVKTYLTISEEDLQMQLSPREIWPQNKHKFAPLLGQHGKNEKGGGDTHPLTLQVSVFARVAIWPFFETVARNKMV